MNNLIDVHAQVAVLENLEINELWLWENHLKLQ